MTFRLKFPILLSLLSMTFYPALQSEAQTLDSTRIKVVFTTDVHGNFFPKNFITLGPSEGSLARVVTAIDSIRSTPGGENLILLDNGDFLQGQPVVYYYNYIDTVSPHLASQVLNYMGYDATTIGNHDVETGHAVYDRWRAQNNMPLLGANVIDNTTGQPYLRPYTVITRNGVKVAVLGLLTPAIPAWLPENLWQGLHFEDMTESARKWVPIIKERENPDIILGLFHSGHDEASMTGGFVENASVKVACEVPGFDAIMIGHDHQRFLQNVVNPEGDTVVVLNPANNARAVGLLDFNVIKDSRGKVVAKTLSANIEDVVNLEPDSKYLETFAEQQAAVTDFVSREIGNVNEELTIEDSLFGPSEFMSLLHQLQLDISGADISFAAPLSLNAVIHKGPLKVSDTFTLYKYENMLYVINMTGREIKDYLEEAYSLWTKQITDKQPHLINFKSDNPTLDDNRLAKPAYNFDSAAGIDYTVDVTKPKGEKIKITGMSNDKPFLPDQTYTVAINSYRANGGGDLLLNGARIGHEELKNRIVNSTDKDLRYYLIKQIEENPDIKVKNLSNWKFIPEKVAAKAAKTDRKLLFSSESSKEQK